MTEVTAARIALRILLEKISLSLNTLIVGHLN